MIYVKELVLENTTWKEENAIIILTPIEHKELPLQMYILPFCRETISLLFNFEKSKALEILRRGRSYGNPNLECKDLLTSTAESMNNS